MQPTTGVCCLRTGDIAELTDVRREELADALSQGVLTETLWRECIEPKLRVVPDKASPTSRALAEIWAGGSIEMEPQLRQTIAESLNSRGYPVYTRYNSHGPTTHELVRPGPETAARLIDRNPTEADSEFAALLGIVGWPSEPVRVAIVEAKSNPDVHHPALAGKVEPLASDSPNADRWHATMVAGIAAQGTELIHLCTALVDSLWTTSAKAIGAGCRIINTSFLDPALAEHHRTIDAHPETLFVKSSGNEGARLGATRFGPGETVPARVASNFIVVANAGLDGELWRGDQPSNYGWPFTTLGAPSEGRMAPNDAGGYCAAGGTSCAAPYITNVAAKCLLLDPALSAADLKTILIVTADRPRGWTEASTYGVVNRRRAMQLAAMSALVRRGRPPIEAAQALGLAPSDPLIWRVDGLFGIFHAGREVSDPERDELQPGEATREMQGTSASIYFADNGTPVVRVNEPGLGTRCFPCGRRSWLEAFARAEGRRVTVKLDAAGVVAGFTVHLNESRP